MADEQRPPRDFITITCKHPGSPPPERCALLVSLPSGPLGIFYGTRAECEARADAVLREMPTATYEIKAMPEEPVAERYPGLPLSLPTGAAVADAFGEERARGVEAAFGPINTTAPHTLHLTATFSSANPADRVVQLERPQPKRPPRRLGWREKRRAAGDKRRGRR